MRPVRLSFSKSKGNEIRFLLKDCPFEPGKYALELNGISVRLGPLVLGIPRLTKAKLELISKRLAEEVAKLK